MAVNYQSREWKLGDSAQKRWAESLARGCVVVPAYALNPIDTRTKAPMLFRGEGELLVAPDLLVLSRTECAWHEVKAKAIPTWRRNHRNGPRWEHGLDFWDFDQYRRVEEESGIAVHIVLFEERSPIDPRAEQRELTGPPMWLSALLQDLESWGEHRPDWPGGANNPANRGRFDQGGWLWPRNRMTVKHLNN
jgi:hypothetical protein